MSLFDKIFKGEESSYTRDDYGTLNPEQKSMVQAYGPVITQNAGKALPMYGTSWQDFSTPMTSGEGDMVARNARMSALGEQGLQYGLAGKFPEQYYRDTIYNPQFKSWQEDILPILNESYSGPSGGGFWGSARAGAVGKSARDLMDKLTADRSQLAWNVQQNVPNAIAAASNLTQTEANAQQLPRLIKQYGLDQLYNEWVRTRPENSPYLNAALNFLNLSTVTEKYNPTKLSGYQALTRGLGVGGFGADLLADNGDWSSTESSANMARNIGIAGMNYGMSFMPSSSGGTMGGGGGMNLGSMMGGGSGGASGGGGGSSGLTSAFTNANSSRLGAMDWRNTGNYSLGGF